MIQHRRCLSDLGSSLSAGTNNVAALTSALSFVVRKHRLVLGQKHPCSQDVTSTASLCTPVATALRSLRALYLKALSRDRRWWPRRIPSEIQKLSVCRTNRITQDHSPPPASRTCLLSFPDGGGPLGVSHCRSLVARSPGRPNQQASERSVGRGMAPHRKHVRAGRAHMPLYRVIVRWATDDRSCPWAKVPRLAPERPALFVAASVEVSIREQHCSTSLTTLALSRDLSFCFCKSGHTFPVSAAALVPFERVILLLR